MTWKDKLKKAWNDNPLLCIAIVGMTLGGAAKFIDAVSSAQSKRAYSKQVDYRVKNRY